MAIVDLVLYSDPHNRSNKFRYGKGDILICTGDGTNGGTEQEFLFLNDFFREQKKNFKYIIYVPGNHCMLFEDDPERGREILSEAIVLIDESVELMGLKFYGSPWTIEFKHFFFMKNKHEIRKCWEKIPQDTQILLTHSPPYSILDYSTHRDEDGAMKYGHVGSESLLNKVLEVKPILHAFGHVHTGYGEMRKDNIRFLNTALAGKNPLVHSDQNPLLVKIDNKLKMIMLVEPVL